MIVPTVARRPIAGYSWVVLSAIGTGFLSFGLWVHHMFTTGLPGVTLALFSAASTAVAIPTGVQFFCFLATLLAGRVARGVPMLYILGGLSTFVIGGLTGVMLAIAPFNFQAHDTFFVVAHLHTVIIGGAVFPLLAGLYYYYPLVGGKMLSDRLGRLSFWLVFIGFNVTFQPMHASGLFGMPRRVFTYPSGVGLDALNLVSTVGAFVLAAGIGVVVWDVLRSKTHQNVAPRNPWGAGTLEWLQEMPGQPWGMRSIPEIDGRYPLWEQANLLRDYDEGRFYLPDAEEGRREMLVTTSVDATPVQCLRIAGPTFITLAAAVFVGGVFVLATYKAYCGRRRQRSPGAGNDPHLAVDRNRRNSGEGDQGRRPRADAAALCVGTRLGGLVGHVHHDARCLHRLRLAGVRLLLLLDTAREFPARPGSWPGPLLAITGRCRRWRRLGPDGSCPSVQSAERCGGLLLEHRRGRRVGDRRWSRAGGGAVASPGSCPMGMCTPRPCGSSCFGASCRSPSES